jgi:hypothetical protein
MLESIGQFGHGYRGPSYHDVRIPWLDRVVDRTTTLRSKHEQAWKEYGCSIISDAWTDTRQRHWINFLANSPVGTFFLASVDASSEVASAELLADLLEKQIDSVGREHVVHIVTDNGSNFRAEGPCEKNSTPVLDTLCCSLFGFIIRGHRKNQGIQ